MYKACVIGHPIKHSLSPHLHEFWLKTYNISGSFVAEDIAPSALDNFIEHFHESPYQGAFVTLPHKEHVYKKAVNVSKQAAIIKAANMLYVENGVICADNSDWYGYYQSLNNHQAYQAHKPTQAVILGAGGASRGIILALHYLGIVDIVIANRTLEKARAIAQDFAPYFHNITPCAWADKEEYIATTPFLINTTSLGLQGEVIDINFAAVPKNALISDIVYKPLITPFLALAKAQGLTTIDGLNMLIYQAIPGFKRYFCTDIEPHNINDTRMFLQQFLS